MELIKNLWSWVTSWDERQTARRKKEHHDTIVESYNKDAMKYINAVPSGNGYAVVFDGFKISDTLSAEAAMKLVDQIRKDYIDKKINARLEIWY